MCLIVQFLHVDVTVHEKYLKGAYKQDWDQLFACSDSDRKRGMALD